MGLAAAKALEPEPRPKGLHLLGDLYGCKGEDRYFFSADLLREHCLRLVAEAGLTPVGDYFHQFGTDGGVTGMVVLAESHLSVHTWPEKRYVTVDVFVCNYTSDNRHKAHKLFNALVDTFRPDEPHVRSVERE
jgi:S-adenosylmethionine decarboxylase